MTMRHLSVTMAAALCIAGGSFNVATAQDTKSVEEIANYRGPDRMQRILEGARKEGRVVFYSSMIINQALRPLMDGFSKKYPFIKAQYVRLGPSEMLQKLTAEANANQFTADVYESVGLEVPSREAQLNIPFWSPEIEHYPKQFRTQPMYWAPVRNNYLGPAYNTSMVAAADIPKSYQDILDPKWKGKLAWSNSLQGAVLFITNMRTSMGEEKALDYLKKLSKQNVALIAASPRTVVDRLVAGEYAIVLSIFLHHPVLDQKKGAPVAPLPLAPIIATPSGMMLPKAPPHPYAAMLLIDYVLSAEGQEILKGAEYFPVRSDVKPLDALRQVVPEKIGVAENYLSPEQTTAQFKKSQQIFDELFSK